MKRVLVLLVGASAAVGACGGDSDSSSNDSAERTIAVEMVDIAFEPTTVAVERGETVRFVFNNRGEVAHDAFIGDPAAQADHEQEMLDTEDAGHGSQAEDDAVTVEPGDTEELSHMFDEAGTVEIGCHQPGHYASGMKITVGVS